MGVIAPLMTVLCLFAAVTSATNSLVELHANELVAAHCHSRVTLFCNMSTLRRDLSVTLLDWIHEDTKKTLCSFNPRRMENDTRILCSYSPQEQLALTFKHVWPSDQGTYICKLRSNLGFKHVNSSLKVQECYRDVKKHSSPSQVKCHFHGVYPRGEVHWFYHGKNVTLESPPANYSGPDPKGLYHVSSSLRTDKTTGHYNCSLWIPSTGVYLTSREVNVWVPPITEQQRNRAASDHTAGLGWALLTVSLLFSNI